MASATNHVPSQRASDPLTNEILPPNPKRRRLNGPQQHEEYHRNQYGPTILNDSSCAIVGNVYETHNHFDTPVAHDEQAISKRLRDSLAFKRMDARLHNVRAALKNTCEWLFRHRTFREWNDDTKLSEHKGFLWLKGKPGCGKSTLMKGAYQWAKARAKKQWITLSYFFNARAPGLLEKSPLGLYRSLVHEILRVAPQSVPMFDEMFSWKDPSDDAEWAIEELQSFLLKFIESSDRPPVVIFIDALDEGDEHDIRALISFLEDLIAHSRENLALRICLSSRHYPNITIRTGLSLIVENQVEHDRDIAKYVREKLLGGGDLEISGLHTTVCKKSAGIFLWVVLVVPILNHIHDQGKSVADMTIYLERLPKDLEGLFADILARDAAELRSCVSLLQWVLYSNTPLSSVELYLAIQHSWHRPDEDVITIPTHSVLTKYLLYHSRGLVEFTDSWPPVVQFIHETVREFLAGEHGLGQVDPALAENLPGWSHAKLTQACLSYFSRNCSQSTLTSYAKELNGHNEKRTRGVKIKGWIPLLPYAMTNLLLHAEAAQRCGISQASLMVILQMSDGQLDPNYLFAYNFCQEHQVRHYKPNVTTLYVAAEHDLPALTSLILTSGNVSVNSKCGRYGNALQAACYNGNEGIVRLLLEAGADVNAVGGEYRTALGAVIAARNFHLFELLKMFGLNKRSAMSSKVFDWLGRPTLQADVREISRLGIWPYLSKTSLDFGLLAATRLLNLELMELLIEDGADVNHRLGAQADSLLVLATSKDSVEAVNLLLRRGADPNGNGWPRSHSPLCEAAASGNEQIMQILLDKGADINFCAINGGTALQVAVNSGFEKIVQMLLERGADVNSEAGLDGNALTIAASHGYEQTVRLLLDRGANINDVGGPKYGSVLSAASACGSKEIVQILLANGADVNAQGGGEYGMSALYLASNRGHEQVVQILLDGGAGVNAITGPCGSPLIAACTYGSEMTVRTLLSRGADVGFIGPHGSALAVATRLGYEKVVQILRAAGAHDRG